jgi:hypothetical protein
MTAVLKATRCSLFILKGDDFAGLLQGGQDIAHPADNPGLNFFKQVEIIRAGRAQIQFVSKIFTKLIDK